MLYRTVNKYCSMFKRGLNGDDIRIFLESSPRYPNLLAVVETLRYAGVEADAARCDGNGVENLSGPALFHLKYKEHDSLAIGVSDISVPGSVKLFNPVNNRWEVKPLEALDKRWDGVVIYAENNPLKKQGIIRWILPLSVLCLVVVTAALKFYGVFLFIPLFLGLSTDAYQYIGIGNKSNSVIDRLCHISSIADCNRVEESVYSSVMGVKMSTLSLAFFSSQLFLVAVSLFLGVSDAVSTVYFISVLLFLPTAAYSIYSQIRVGKMCPLCVMTLLCVAAEAVIFVTILSRMVNVRALLLWCLVAVAMLCALHYVAVLRIKQRESFAVRTDLLKLKRRNDIMMTESRLVGPVLSPMWLGCEHADVNITTVISPGCKHCRQLVGEVLSILDKTDLIRWNIVLGAVKESDTAAIERWLSRYSEDKTGFMSDLSRWCKSGKPIDASRPPVDKETKRDIIDFFDQAKERLKISSFPAIILNDRLLSSLYTPGDLKYIVSDLKFTTYNANTSACK